MDTYTLSYTYFINFVFKIIDLESVRVRLVGGSTENEGRVEVYFDNIWGTVCHDYWNAPDNWNCRIVMHNLLEQLCLEKAPDRYG